MGGAIYPTGSSSASQGPVFLPAVERIPTVVEYHGLRGWLRRLEPRGLCRWVSWRIAFDDQPIGPASQDRQRGRLCTANIEASAISATSLCLQIFCLPAIGTVAPREQIALWLPNEFKRVEARLHRSLAHRKSRGRQAATRMCRRPVIGIYQAPGCLVFLR